eukprot:3326370-Amphidinium_carterae.1
MNPAGAMDVAPTNVAMYDHLKFASATPSIASTHKLLQSKTQFVVVLKVALASGLPHHILIYCNVINPLQ